MIINLRREDVANLTMAMRKMLPSLLTTDEKVSCERIYKKLIKVIESDFKKSAKQNGR